MEWMPKIIQGAGALANLLMEKPPQHERKVLVSENRMALTRAYEAMIRFEPTKSEEQKWSDAKETLMGLAMKYNKAETRLIPYDDEDDTETV